MKKRRILNLTAALMLTLTGCTKIEQESVADVVPVTTETTQLQTTEPTTEEIAPQHEAVALQVPEITRQEASLTLEAEDAAIPTGCSVAVMPRLGYSGTGYLSGLDAKNETSLTLEAEIPATQHYDITFVVGSSEGATCKISANGEAVYTLTTEGKENFVRIMVQGIFLSEGTCKLSIAPTSGTMDIDCVELVNNTSLYDESAAISQEPVNSSASPEAKRLLRFLTDNYGQKIITGQYVSDHTGKELDKIYITTGKYPLIRFADMSAYSRNGGDATSATVIEDSLAWAQEGGVVGLTWYWYAPTGNGTVYAEEATFDLAAAVTDADIVNKSDQELAKMASVGEISQACYALLQDIDNVSVALKELADANVPVLWRPLMEAGGGWYWWGAAGADAYRWLWNLMYTRMTEYHHLNNLLWVWNGQSSNYLVEENQYDIASLDLYVDQEEPYGSRYEQYVALRNMTSGKLLAISECSTVPDMNAMFRDNAVWSFFGLWYAPYLGEYTDDNALIAVYNSEGALTREDYMP